MRTLTRSLTRSLTHGLARRLTNRTLAYLAGAVALCFWLSALAQPADPTANPEGFFNQLWQAGAERKWGLVAVLATIMLVALVRWVAPKIHGKFGALLNSDRGGTVLALIAAVASSLATTAMAGITLTPKVIVDAIVVAGGAIGLYHTGWNLFSPGDKKPPANGAAPTGGLPPVVKPALLIGFMLPLTFVNFSCATASPATKAFGASYGACMEQKGLAVALDPNVEKEGLALLNGGNVATQITQDLEGLAGRAGIDAVSCLVSSWLGQRGAALNPAGVEGGKAFLAKHTAQPQTQPAQK